MHDNYVIGFANSQFDYLEYCHFYGATPTELVDLATALIRNIRIVFLLAHL